MSFLAPLFLAGAAAVILPILFHLIRRSVKERQVFSSLMFLLPSPPRLTRRSRLEHLLLLALRCLAVILLAGAFARPFFKQPVLPDNAQHAPRRIAVLLDTSASMQRPDLWEQARAKAEALVRQTNPQDEVALYTFDRRLEPICSFADWKALAPGERLGFLRSRLAQTQPGWLGTWLDQALIEAAELVTENGNHVGDHRREIIVITDLQEGSRLTALQGHEWPKGVQVTIERLSPRHPGNAGLQLVGDSADMPALVDNAGRIRISNASDSKKEQFRVMFAPSPPGRLGEAPLPDEKLPASEGRPNAGKDAGTSRAVEVYVPPGQSRIISLPATQTNVAIQRVLLLGDEQPFDNTVFVVPPSKVQHTILYLGEQSERDGVGPFFFLEKALQDTRLESIRLVKAGAGKPISAPEWEATTLIVGTVIPRRDADQLRTAIQHGKTLLFAPTTSAAAAGLGDLLQSPSVDVREKPADQYAMLGQIDFGHPLFAPFADPRYSDFTKIHFWKYRQFGANAFPQARVLARFDSGDPAIIEIDSGRGRVFVLASCWYPADSQLALSSKFVPLLYSLLELSGAAPPPPAHYLAGEQVPVPASGMPATIQRPDGTSIQLSGSQTNFEQALVPGIYSVLTSQPPIRFAVNVDPAESRTAALSADDLEKLGVPLGRNSEALTATARSKVQLKNAELEARQKVWRWVIIAALAVLAVETWLAGRTSRRVLPQPENA